MSFHYETEEINLGNLTVHFYCESQSTEEETNIYLLQFINLIRALSLQQMRKPLDIEV